MSAVLGLIFSLLFLCGAAADEPLVLEKIVVSSHLSASETKSLKKTYSLQSLTSQDLKEKNLNCLSDVLEYVSGMDLRYRSGSGVQGDLSLRGSTYEQVAVLIDGVRVMDPQTGHHNLDIPLTLFDIDRVEVMKEGSSALYGAGGFAGSVNFITKKPAKKALNLDALFGQHALFGQAFSLSLPEEYLSSRVSFEHKIAKAARPNTDFEYSTASLYVDKDFGGAELDTLFGYQEKDFGADSFYSNLFPEEEEHTRTIFARAGLVSGLGPGSLKNSLFFRKHRDKFILRRNNPTSVNYHTTYVYGFNSTASFATRYGNLTSGLDLGRDEINSTNLGKHSRSYEAGLLALSSEWGARLSTDFRFRLDYYEKWGWQESFNAGAGYQIIDEKLRLKGSFARAFRIPSFTDLYYSDAANKGNPGLGVEKSDTFALGLEFKEKLIDWGLEGFLRQGHDLIDWTRSASTDPWKATNLGRVDFMGVAVDSGFKPDFTWKGLKVTKLNFSYSYNHADKKASGFFSKYALDILMHQFGLGINSGAFGLAINWQLGYNKRYYGETYFVGNLYIAKKLVTRNLVWEPFVSVDNFSNAKYSEVSGVVQPGRWIKSGLKFEW